MLYNYINLRVFNDTLIWLIDTNPANDDKVAFFIGLLIALTILKLSFPIVIEHHVIFFNAFSIYKNSYSNM